ncbi:MAG TPA: copper chaperone PCu(A)C [Stellaceae bacterium]|jgi:copper(I)-binding protein|nr:copper chaperone PCu(A)C [Stellaceae bacterium]
MNRLALIVALLAGGGMAWDGTPWCGVAQAAAPAVGIQGAWALAGSAKSGLGFVYMTLTLPHGASDTLTGVEADVASRVEIVASSGAQPPAPTSALLLDGAAPLIMQTRGTHLILHGLKMPLKPGETVKLTLHFAKAGTVPVTVTARAHAPEYGMPSLPGGIRLD